MFTAKHTKTYGRERKVRRAERPKDDTWAPTNERGTVLGLTPRGQSDEAALGHCRKQGAVAPE